MRDSTYIGRLFFGDKESEEAVWDLDCRPSDGIFQLHWSLPGAAPGLPSNTEAPNMTSDGVDFSFFFFYFFLTFKLLC